MILRLSKGKHFPEEKYTSEVIDNVLEDSSAIVLLTSWPEYRNLHLKLIAQEVPVIDGRRFLEKDKFKHYVGIGYNPKKNSNFKTEGVKE